MTITVKLTKSFNRFNLDVDFTMPSRGVTGLLGPSGSGKTCLLRCIAGLERAQGTFAINNEVWQDKDIFTPAHRRPVGYVFQESSLFEHLTVQENLEYGQHRIQEAQRTFDFQKTVELMGIGSLLKRGTSRLSGGERQRVAIARALLTSPRLLLMDEPLASLDHESKEELLPFLSAIHHELSIPVFYVSHSAGEISRLADHLVLIQKGVVIASDDIHEVTTQFDLPLALSSDAESIIEANVLEHDDKYHLSYLEYSGGKITVSRISLKPGSSVRVRISARDVSLVLSKHEDTSIQNVYFAEVEEISISVEMAQLVVRLNVNGSILLARITRKSAELLEIKPGKMLYAQVKCVSLLI